MTKHGLKWVMAALGIAVFGTACWQRPRCCTAEDQCSSGYSCVGGVCRARCSFAGECSGGQSCNSKLGVCVGGRFPDYCGLRQSTDAAGLDTALQDVQRADLRGIDVVPADRGRPDLHLPDISPPDFAFVDRRRQDVSPDKPPDDAPLGEGPLVDSGNCPDDLFEENDSRGEAVLLGGPPIQAILCPGDVDFFMLNRQSDAEARAELDCSQAAGPILMILRLPTGVRQVRSCDPVVGTASAALAVSQPGPAYIEITSSGQTPRSTYSLEAWVEGLNPPCGEDPFEENDTVIDAFALRQGNDIHASVCATDTDFYAVPVTINETLEVVQEFQDSCFGDRLTLYQPDGTTVLDESAGMSGSRTVFARAQQTGQHYIQVVSLCADSVYYALSIGSEQCSDDGYEDNDIPEQGVEVSPDQSFGAQICRDDEDYFFINAGVLDHLRLDLVGNSNGDLDLALFNPLNQRVELSQLTGSVESIDYQALESGRYTAGVYGFGGSVGSYQLQICIDDLLEDNDSRRSPTLNWEPSIAAKICGYDRDFYALELVAGHQLVARASQSVANAQLQLCLYRSPEDDAPICGTPGVNSTDLDYLVSVDGQYFLGVLGQGISTEYVLEVTQGP